MNSKPLNWELVSSCTVSELPKLFWTGPTILQASWKTKHFKRYGKTHLKRKTNSCNPRLLGTTEFVDFSEWSDRTPEDAIVLSEYLLCAGKNNCILENGKCKCSIKWIIRYGNREKVEIYRSGSHGDINFKPKARQSCGIPSLIQLETDSMILKGETASTIEKSVTTMQGTKFLGNGAAATVTRERITSRMNYLWKKKTRGLTERELVAEILRDKTIHEDLIVWPPHDHDEVNTPNSGWKIILTEKTLLQGLATHGNEIVGLDSVYKFTKYGFPMWLLVYRHSQYLEGMTAAICLASSGDAENITFFLDFIKRQVEEVSKKPWNPIVMIDKDSAERKACEDVNLQHVLCNYHSTVAINRALNKRTTNKESRGKLWGLIKNLQRSKSEREFDGKITETLKQMNEISKEFAKYFKENWIDQKWNYSFADVFRKENEGFWNTNNFTEAQIRKIGSVFLRRRSTSLYLLLMKLITEVVPHFVIRNTQLEDGEVTRIKSQKTMKAIKRRSEEGKKLSEKVQRDSGSEDKYLVKSKQTYCVEQVSVEDECYWVCDCKFWQWSGKSCKHVFAVLFHIEETAGLDNLDAKTPIQEGIASGVTRNPGRNPATRKTNRSYKKAEKRGRRKKHKIEDFLPVERKTIIKEGKEEEDSDSESQVEYYSTSDDETSSSSTSEVDPSEHANLEDEITGKRNNF